MANTASTKSTGSKAAGKKERARSDSAKNAPVETAADDVPERVWWICVVVIFVIAAALRMYDLNLVPLHHDEGVNGNFLVRLVREDREPAA